MTPEQFAYWLQGYVELNDGMPPNSKQWVCIMEHLNTVFTKVTPGTITIINNGSKMLDPKQYEGGPIC